MFTDRDILIITLAIIIAICATIIAVIWIAECIIYVHNLPNDSFDDTQEFNFVEDLKEEEK